MSIRFWAIIVIIVVAAGAVLTFHGSKKPSAATLTAEKTGASAAPASVVSDVTSVPASTLDTIGQGTAQSYPKAIAGTPLTENNKPEVYYEGAEYCPYCATERWAMAVALSRFGTFSNLKVTHSSPADVYANTRTLSFYGSTYKSDYITFTSVELYTNIESLNGGYTTLQTPTTAEQNLANKYDSGGGIPFIDFGGKYDISGATYSPQVLSGASWQQIASSLANANSPTAQGVDGAANTITAAICKLTNNQPGSACDSTIQAMEAKL